MIQNIFHRFNGYCFLFRGLPLHTFSSRLSDFILLAFMSSLYIKYMNSLLIKYNVEKFL